MTDLNFFQNYGLRMSLMTLALALIIGAGLVRLASLKFRQLSKYLTLAGFMIFTLVSYYRPGQADYLQTGIFALFAALTIFDIVNDHIKQQRAEAQSDKISLEYVRKKMRKG